MAVHTWGWETNDRYEPVVCAVCKDECDRHAHWLKLDDEWSWLCSTCWKALDEPLPGDKVNEEGDDGTVNGD